MPPKAIAKKRSSRGVEQVKLEIMGISECMDLDRRLVEEFGGVIKLESILRNAVSRIIDLNRRANEKFLPTAKLVRQQMESCLRNQPESWAHSAYMIWCEENNLEPVSEEEFNHAATELGGSIAKRFKYIIQKAIKPGCKVKKPLSLAEKKVTGFTKECKLKLDGKGFGALNEAQNPDEYLVLK